MKTQLRLFFLSMVIAAGSFAQGTLTTSLTACYPLNGNANEPVNNLTGTLSAATATVDRFNNPNSAMAFNGTPGCYIELPNSPLLKSPEISASAWVKLNSDTESHIMIYVHNGCSVYYEGYQLAFTNEAPNLRRFQAVKSNFMCSAQGQTIAYSTTGNYQANTWYHVGFWATADSMKLFVNGVQEGLAVIPQPLVYSATAGVILGGTNNSPNVPLNGTLDNVRFYNRKLSNSEMMQLYQQDPACTVPSVTTSVSESEANSSFRIFPNPNSGKFQVSSEHAGVVTMEVYNPLGVKVRELKTDDRGVLQVDLSEQPAGVYLLRSEELGLVRKVVVRRD